VAFRAEHVKAVKEGSEWQASRSTRDDDGTCVIATRTGRDRGDEQGRRQVLAHSHTSGSGAPQRRRAIRKMLRAVMLLDDTFESGRVHRPHRPDRQLDNRELNLRGSNTDANRARKRRHCRAGIHVGVSAVGPLEGEFSYTTSEGQQRFPPACED
jgi:hypothetical protein